VRAQEELKREMTGKFDEEKDFMIDEIQALRTRRVGAPDGTCIWRGERGLSIDGRKRVVR